MTRNKTTKRYSGILHVICNLVEGQNSKIDDGPEEGLLLLLLGIYYIIIIILLLLLGIDN